MTADTTVPHVPMDSPEWAEVKDYIAKLKVQLAGQPATSALSEKGRMRGYLPKAVDEAEATTKTVAWYRRLWGSSPPPPPVLLSEAQLGAVLKSIMAVAAATEEEEKGRVAILASFLKHHSEARLTAEQACRLVDPFKWGFAVLPLLRDRIIDPENNHVIYARFFAWAVPKAKQLLEG